MNRQRTHGTMRAMDPYFWLHYGLALAIVALTLLGLHAAIKPIAARNGISAPNARLLAVVETTALTAQTQLHVVRVGDRHIVVASARESVAYLGEVASEALPVKSNGIGRVCSRLSA